MYLPLLDGPAAPAGLPTVPEGAYTALAHQLTQADTPEARTDALLAVMEAIGVGVYAAADATPLLVGEERAANDFYLYDFELDFMATSLERAETWSVGDLAMTLSESGVFSTEVTLGADALYGILIEGVQEAAAAPTDRLSLVPLLVRELGLRHSVPYDLLAGPDLDTLRFDALQRWLILADILVPIVEEMGPVEEPSQLAAQSGGFLKLSPTDDSPCKAIGSIVKEGWSFGKWALALSKKISPKTKVAAVVIDAIHGPIVAFGIKVTELDSSLRTHYGHDAPGQEFTFRIKVEMQDDLPELLVKCGWLAGVEFPPKGPVSQVTVLWLDDGFGLRRHGDLSCSTPCMSKTGADGIATLVFSPRQEIGPPTGMSYEVTGVMTGIALYLTRFKNIIGTVNQVITPKSAGVRWFVEYHRPPGWWGTIMLQKTLLDEGSEAGPAPNCAETQRSWHIQRAEVQRWDVVQVDPDWPYLRTGWSVRIDENWSEDSYSMCVAVWCDGVKTEKTVRGEATGSYAIQRVPLNGVWLSITDNHFEISSAAVDVDASAVVSHKEETRTVITYGKPGPGCENQTITDTREGKADAFEEFWEIDGELDPAHPNVIIGSRTWQSTGPGATTNYTLLWHLER